MTLPPIHFAPISPIAAVYCLGLAARERCEQQAAMDKRTGGKTAA